MYLYDDSRRKPFVSWHLKYANSDYFYWCLAAGDALTGPPAGSDAAGPQHRDPKAA